MKNGPNKEGPSSDANCDGEGILPPDKRPVNDPASEADPAKKITHRTARPKKSPTGQCVKSPTGQHVESPSNTVPVELLVVVSEYDLKTLLLQHGFAPWATPLRVKGLLMLLAYIVRRHDRHGVCVSSEVSFGYVSKLKRKGENVPTRPLAVLERIGILRKIAEHVSFPSFKRPPRYRIPSDLLKKQKKEMVGLPPKLLSKRENANQRQHAQLNRKLPWRENLLLDLVNVGLTSAGRDIALRTLTKGGKKEAATRQFLQFVDGDREAHAKANGIGTINTNISSMPTELVGEITLGGQHVAECDVSYCHICLFPLLIEDRLLYYDRKGCSAAKRKGLKRELTSLRAFLSSGDYYRHWCIDTSDDAERGKVQKEVIMALNMATRTAQHIPIYKRMRKKFPHTFGIIEDIKHKDHRVISRRLQHWTSQVINGALLELQGRGIPAIPRTDSLVIPAQYKQAACEAIGKRMYDLTGVRCKVGGARYAPKPKC